MSLRLWLQIMGPKRYSCGIFLGHGCNVKVSAINKLLLSFYWFILHLWFVVQGATHVPHIMSVWESIKDRGQLWNYFTCFDKYLKLCDSACLMAFQLSTSNLLCVYVYLPSRLCTSHIYNPLSYSGPEFVVSINHNNQVDLILATASLPPSVSFNISI